MDKLLHTSLFRAILKSLNRKVVSEKRLQTYFLKFARLITHFAMTQIVCRHYIL